MKQSSLHLFLGALGAWLLLAGTLSARAEMARGDKGIAATVHPLATDAAIQAFQKGGNAVDAAVAAALTLGVVDGFNSGIGGGCLILIRRPNGSYVAVDGREAAPSRATRDMYLRHGKADPQLSQSGALAVATPGALAAYADILKRWGKLPLKDLLLAAAKVAEDGFKVTSQYGRVLANAAPELAKYDGARAVFLKPDGQPYAEGDLLKQPDLAGTYRAVATHGLEWFYGGPFAQATAGWMKTNGGLLTVVDFKNYQSKIREVPFTYYHGYVIAAFPPPSSGGVHVLQMLNMLEHQDLKALGAGSADAVHVMAETMKRAFADRAHWLGDPDFVKVPKGLISKKYARALAAGIDRARATEVKTHGTPDNAQSDVFGKHTTHLSTADAEGYWVALTATVNTSFGSKVVIPGTGVLLNNEMDDFSANPGAPNHFQLVGGDANAIAPYKRPLSSMSPVIVQKDGQPVLALGAAGGPTIISQVLLGLINYIDFGLPLDQAIGAPRFHQQWAPDELKVEAALGTNVIAGLEKRGHTINQVPTFGVSQAVGRAPDGKGFVGAHDPRVQGKAAGW